MKFIWNLTTFERGRALAVFDNYFKEHYFYTHAVRTAASQACSAVQRLRDESTDQRQMPAPTVEQVDDMIVELYEGSFK